MSHTKTVLITGANKGIGYAAARQLGALGYTILLGARSETRGKEAAEKLVSEGFDARHIVLDVTDQGTIDSASEQIAAEFGSLDVLINNAGASFEAFAPPSQLELSHLKATYETNFFGVFAVTKAFLPLLTQSPAGRIVNVSSGLGSLSFMSNTADEYANFNDLEN